MFVPAWEEPISGWADNLNGPGGLSLGNSTGVVRIILMNSDVQADFMPVDLAIRGLAIVAYIRNYSREDAVHMYNWCAQERSITYSDLTSYGLKLRDESPSKYILWRPVNSTTNSHFYFYLNFFIFQLIPAFFLDLALRLFGKEPMLWKLLMRVYISMKALSHFTLNYFQFDNHKAIGAERWLLKEDFSDFSYLITPDKETIYNYLKNSTIYIQRKFLKMDEKDRAAAHKLNIIMKTLDRAVKAGFCIFVIFTVYSHNLIPRLLSSTYEMLLPF